MLGQASEVGGGGNSEKRPRGKPSLRQQILDVGLAKPKSNFKVGWACLEVGRSLGRGFRGGVGRAEANLCVACYPRRLRMLSSCHWL